jgi:cytochrome P450
MYRQIPFVERCRRRYGPIFTLRLGPGRNVVLVAEPGQSQSIVSGDPDIYRAGDANGILRPVVGSNSLLTLDGATHMRHRRILQPAVGPEHGRALGEAIAEIARERVSRWSPGERVNLLAEMESIALEVILGVVLGDEPPEQRERFRRLIPEMMRRCASPFTLLPYFRRELGGITPYARLRRVLEELDQHFFAAIDRRRDGDAEAGTDALSLLVAATDEKGAPLPNREIRDELLTMIMAGYETTTGALAWTFERLMRSPAALQSLTLELADGGDEYLEAVVKESLRLRPVVPVVARKIREEVELDGYRVPAGSVLMVSIYLLHRDPALHEDPDEFRPERFLQGEPEEAPWIPFGGGVRRCLGASFAQLEMKIVIRTVLGLVRLSAPDPESEPVARRRFTFAPGHGASAIVQPAAESRH